MSTANTMDAERLERGIREVQEAARAEVDAINDLLESGDLRVVGIPPPPPTDLFFGRREEMQRLTQYLHTPGVLIVAIVGEAGFGKTALARKILHELQEGRWPEFDEEPFHLNGVAYLSTRTSGISIERLFLDCALLLPSIQEQGELVAVWGQQKSVSDKVKHLLKAMRGGTYIVLLDNLEEKLDSKGEFEDPDLAEFFRTLVDQEMVSDARVIVTSRRELAERLRCSPPHREVALEDGLSVEDGIVMLRECDTSENLRLRCADNSILEKFVRETRGAPRALELIASILGNDPGATLDEVDLCLSLPEDERLKALSVRNFRALGEDARLVSQALAIYSRPVPAIAVEYLLSPFHPLAGLRAAMEGMSRTRAIGYESPRAPKSGLPAPPALLSLHAIDLETAYEQIPVDADYCRATLHQRAADYYQQMRLPMPWKRIAQLEPQLLEFQHRVTARDHVGALGVIDSIDYSRVNHHKFLAHMMLLGYGAQAIERRLALNEHLQAPEDRAVNLTCLSWVYRRMGWKNEARDYFEKALEEAERATNPEVQVFAHSEWGYFLTDNENEHEAAEQELRAILERSRELGDRYAEAHSLLGLAFAAFQQPGKNEESEALARKAGEIFHELGPGWPDDTLLPEHREIDCLTRLSMIHRKTMNYEKGIEVVRQALEVVSASRREEWQLQDWEAELHSQLGFHYRALGVFGSAPGDAEQPSGAIGHHHKALDLFQRHFGMKREEAVQHSYLGNLYTENGDFIRAERHFTEAHRLAETIDLRRELSWILSNWGILAARKGDYPRALERQRKALKIVDENQNFDSQVIRHTDLAATHLALGEWDEVEYHVLSALQIAARPKTAHESSSLPEAFIKAEYLEDRLPHEMLSQRDHQRRGFLVANAYFGQGRFAEARDVLAKAAEYDTRPYTHSIAALQGAICVRLGDASEARRCSEQAIEDAQVLLERTSSSYAAECTRGLANSSLALLAQETERPAYMERARDAYERALKICGGEGNGIKTCARDVLAELDPGGVLSAVKGLLAS